MTQIEKVTISCNFVLTLRELKKKVTRQHSSWYCILVLFAVIAASLGLGVISTILCCSVLDIESFDNVVLFKVLLMLLFGCAYCVMLSGPFTRTLHVSTTDTFKVTRDEYNKIAKLSDTLLHNNDNDNVIAFEFLNKLNFMSDIIPNWKVIAALFGSSCNVYVDATEKIAQVRNKENNELLELKLDSVLMTKNSYTSDMLLLVNANSAYCYDTKANQREVCVALIK